MAANDTNTTRYSHNQIILTSFDKHFFIASLAILIPLGTVGNALVLYVFGWKRRGKRTRSELMFALLAFTDFFSSLFLPFLIVYRYIWIPQFDTTFMVVCIGVETCLGINITVSEGILILICLERNRGVTAPLSSPTRLRLVSGSIIGFHILAVLILAPFWTTSTIFCKTVSTIRTERLIIMDIKEDTILAYACLTTIRDVLALFSLLVLNRNTAIGLKTSEGNFQDGNRSAKFRKARRLLIVVVVCFGICILPDSIVTLSMISLIYQGYVPTNPNLFLALLRAVLYTRILQLTSSVINPIIYTFMHPRFVIYRAKVKNLTKRYLFCGCHQVHEDIPQSSAFEEKKGKTAINRTMLDNKGFIANSKM